MKSILPDWRRAGIGAWWRSRRPEITLLGWLLAVAAALWMFLQLADLAEDETPALDTAVLLALRNPLDLADPVGPEWLELTARDMTSLGGYPVLVLVTLAAAGFLLIARRPGVAVIVLVAIGGGMLLSTGLKVAFERSRPDLVPHAVQVYTLSFPSGHAMLSAVTYLTLGALLARAQPRRRLRIYLMAVAIVLTLLIGASRVYLGVHWPTDVLAGWCAGGAWATACWAVVLWLQQRGKVERDNSMAPDEADVS